MIWKRISFFLFFLFFVLFLQENVNSKIITKNFQRNIFQKSNYNQKYSIFKIFSFKTNNQNNPSSSSHSLSSSNSSNSFKNNPSVLTIKECLDYYNSNLESGLTNNEVNNRLNKYGLNELQIQKKTSLLTLFKEQFSDRLSQILLSIVLISTLSSLFETNFNILLHSLTEPIILLSILILNAITGISQSRSAENSLSALNKFLPRYASVLRNGEWLSIPSNNLVPGDIILLRVGDNVPADARLIEIKTLSFSTDESFLTGENIPILKGIETLSLNSNSGIIDQFNMIFSGSTVTEGSAIAIVVKTGKNTEIGQINTDVQIAKSQISKTPLTESLDKFTQQLTNIVGMICLTIWSINIPYFKSSFGSWFKGALQYGKNAIALGVAAVPEGLSPAITLCLSLGTHRMAKNNVIVRKLSSIETLGCTSVICTDKTGTLTTNQMCVTSLITFNNSDLNEIIINERKIEGNSYSPNGRIENSKDINTLPIFEDISKICTLCNNAEISYSKENGYNRVGEPTEAALKVLVEKIGINQQNNNNNKINDSSLYILNQYGKKWKSNYQLLVPLEFTRERKSMSVLCSNIRDNNDNNNNDNNNVLFTKGAAELVFNRCKYIKLENGEIIEITNNMREKIMKKIIELSQRPLRLIATAYKTNKNSSLLDTNFIKSIKNATEYEQIESDMILTSICGIEDPLRNDIKDSIIKCKDAGIRIMMITGDSKDTALSIGYKSGILTNITESNNNSNNNNNNNNNNMNMNMNIINESIMSGKEFRELSTEKQKNYLRNGNKVFYRTEPKDKQLLIKLLKELNEVTAMTGDGVNDASALSTADIGIAMGITGTEVTKNSADMILSNDSFSSIVLAIEEGRTIYSNLQSMINYLISCNLGEIGIILLASLLRLPEPLSPLHLLWANLVTDGPPATSLSLNPSDKENMKKLPRRRNEPIISKEMIGKYIITSTYEALATIGSFLWWFNNYKISWKQLTCRSLECNNALSKSLLPFSLSQPQSMALSVLLLIEMLKAMSSISRDQSLLNTPPWKNKWLMLMIFSSISIHMIFMYIPFLSNLLKISPLNLNEWKVVMLFSFPILIIEEIFKFIQRNRNKKLIIDRNRNS